MTRTDDGWWSFGLVFVLAPATGDFGIDYLVTCEPADWGVVDAPLSRKLGEMTKSEDPVCACRTGIAMK
jgi:hypothetical protein